MTRQRDGSFRFVTSHRIVVPADRQQRSKRLSSEKAGARMINGTPLRQPTAELVLDDQERAIVALVANGLVLDAIARRLALSERTVRRRIRAMCDRVGVDTPVQVVVLAARQGVV